MISPAQIIRDGEAAAIQAYDAYRDSSPETFPEEVAGRLLEGEHPVRGFRDHRGLTQAQLAQAAGLKQSYVSQSRKSRPGRGTAR